MTDTHPAHNAALQVIQQAVTVLGKWVGVDIDLTNKFSASTKESEGAAKEAMNMLWSDSTPKALKSLFNSVKLSEDTQNKQHFWKPQAIANENPKIPYPQKEQPTDFEELKKEVKEALNNLNSEDWENLSLLNLILEKFCSFISSGESDIALIDIARSTAAVAAAIANNQGKNEFSLIAGDLSGIQNFIYTISSDGALKSLRARSFYLELVVEEVVQQLLIDLKLPRTNVIYAGGGNFYILAAATEKTKEAVEQIRDQFNKWLLREFQGKVFLALDCLNFPIEDIKTAKFAQTWSDITSHLSKQKSQKFAEQINNFIQPSYSHEPCKVCHRDDVEKLDRLNKEELDSVMACETCRNMFRLGEKLLNVKAIVRSYNKVIDKRLDSLSFEIPAHNQRPAINIYYHLFKNWKQIDLKNETTFLVNDWEVEHYKFRHFSKTVPLLLGDYATESIEKKGSIMRANEFANLAKGIDRVAYLRMDVDRLGRIFAEGLGNKKTLPRIACLSRQMSYFFKVYLNSLAEKRADNLPNNYPESKYQSLTSDPRQNLLFIYAGGDDLFVSGAWNEVVEFAFDVYQCFRAYTGHNPDITLSGGISIADAKFPLYQAAAESGEAEEAAKGNGKDSLGLFGEVFKWDEWLGFQEKDSNVIDEEIRKYLKPVSMPELLGILPFVERLEKQNIGINYSRNFVRNLLITAQIQKEALQKVKDKKSEEAKGTRYYLHLPKIAYTLTRLPNHVLKDEDFRKSLKSPYNAPYFRAIATWIELLNRG